MGGGPWLSAFWELCTDRTTLIGPSGDFVPLRIPHGAIAAYADRYGYAGPEEFARFLRCIRAMDAEWLAFEREAARAARERGDGQHWTYSDETITPGLTAGLF